MREQIDNLFKELEGIPLFYIESGSRLWGIASPAGASILSRAESIKRILARGCNSSIGKRYPAPGGAISKKHEQEALREQRKDSLK